MRLVIGLLIFGSWEAFGSELQNLKASGADYNSYQIYETNVKSVHLQVDYRVVRAGCHGLDYAYEVKQVVTGKYLIIKNILLKPMVLCPPHSDQYLQSGVRLEIPVRKAFTGFTALAEVIVAAESDVVLERVLAD